MATDCSIAVGWAKSSAKLLSWGANSYGQLSQSHTEDQLLPGEATPSDIEIKSISGGGGHTLVIDKRITMKVDEQMAKIFLDIGRGDLHVCGSNNKGQLGLSTTQDVHILTRVRLPRQQKVVKATGGWDFTMLVTENGELFCMGSNAFGQLGLPGVQYISEPTQVPFEKKIKDVGAGLRHTVAVTEEGCVYCWGAGRRGQCGILVDGKCPAKLTSPSQVTLPPCGAVIGVVSGSHYSMAWTDKGELLTWGCNKFGQCTQDPDAVKQIHCPSIASTFTDERVSSLYSGWTHALATTDTDKVYSWGRGDYGQLGRPCDRSCDAVPGLVTGLPRVNDLSCGSEHNLALSDKGEVISWGWNEHGICGTGDEKNVFNPKKVAALSKFRISHVGCGNGHSFAFSQEVT